MTGAQLEAFLLERATVFNLGENTTLELRLQRDGTRLWVVKQLSHVLTKSGRFEYEPQPSSRTDAFLKRTRFEDVEAAISVAMKAGLVKR